MTTPTVLTALHAVARAALRHRDRTGTQGVLSEALDRLTASGWRPDGPESEEALAGLLGALGWQPIETAPRKDSALLWFPFGETFSNGISGCMFVGIWTYGPTGAFDEEVLSWRDPGDFESLGEPTHWMPLPEPPAISPDAQTPTQGPPMTCPRPDPTQKCTTCGAPPAYPCPMTEDEPAALEGEAITAGTSGACEIGGEECESCQ